jgi:hypothetical protein
MLPDFAKEVEREKLGKGAQECGWGKKVGLVGILPISRKSGELTIDVGVPDG